MKAGHSNYSHSMQHELTNPHWTSDAGCLPVEATRKKRLLKLYERHRQSQLTFCSAFYAALPRELRDMVYDQIVTPNKQNYVLKAHETFNDETGKLEHPFFDADLSMPEDPGMRSDVWKFVEYTGEAVGKEIAEHWYRTGRFDFDAEDCLLQKFLTEDVWHRGIVPADVVHHLHITLNPMPYIVPTDSMEADLESLFAISNKNSELVFEIVKQRYHAALANGGMSYVLALIAPYVYRLRTEGFSRVAAYQDLIDLHRKSFPWTFCPWDITYFFEIEQEEFETVFCKESGHDDERDKRIADVISRCRGAGRAGETS